ncbi:hypothetical protein GYMLUDRAFT_244864 [Collybiopsis luxurians FD-317 M1]|uniref:Uncharacterized protein n=1 Tax=Collybiopsis luxurians FD-317 M1 TaxID=944289 RepID=A0A0D0CAY2_9AGAR|nr:hypothetical protein GYMLUDRAFT_244864 [Collybiopsis luxurians FD-317 M1]
MSHAITKRLHPLVKAMDKSTGIYEFPNPTIVTLRLKSSLLKRRWSYFSIIQHPLTLKECLSSPPPFHSSSYDPPPSIPEDLHFKTHDTVT